MIIAREGPIHKFREIGIDDRFFVIVECQFGGYKLGMLQKFRLTISWIYLAFIGFATLSPAQLRPTLTVSEPSQIVSLEHVCAFGLLGVLFSIAYPRRHFLVCLPVFGSAVLFECLQFIVPDRDPRIVDALEKLLGGAIGIFLVWMFSRYISSSKVFPAHVTRTLDSETARGLESSALHHVNRRQAMQNSAGESGVR